MTITEGNKLIAEFMGENPAMMKTADNTAGEYHIMSSGHGGYVPLNYHKSWDSLMPVVDNIESTDADGFHPFAVDIEDDECVIKDYRGEGYTTIAYENAASKIESVWKATVAFIEWINANPELLTNQTLKQ